MFNKEIGIDLGTSNILIFTKKEGIVLNEPSVVAIDSNKQVLAVGIEAHNMLGRTPGKVYAIKPMKDGVIADFELTEIMLNYFLKKIKVKSLFYKPTILICCPANITEVEKTAIKEAAEKTGAKKVYIEEEPKVAAIGSGLDISKACGTMIVDMGGGTTDIAVLSLGDIVSSISIKIAGNAFDNEIIKYIKDNYNLLIGEITAEDLKKKIGTVYDKNKKEKKKVRGRSIQTGLPTTITISSEEIEKALKPLVYKIIDSIKQVLEQTPPELSADIYSKGIILTGGSSLIHGLDKFISKELKVPVTISKNPLTSVVIGTGKMLENLYLLNE